MLHCVGEFLATHGLDAIPAVVPSADAGSDESHSPEQGVRSVIFRALAAVAALEVVLDSLQTSLSQGWGCLLSVVFSSSPLVFVSC